MDGMDPMDRWEGGLRREQLKACSGTEKEPVNKILKSLDALWLPVLQSWPQNIITVKYPNNTVRWIH